MTSPTETSSNPSAGIPDAPIISLRDLTKTFINGELPVPVLHGVSLDIHPGEFVAIVGASGSGKSTLMNLLGCLDRPTSGSYRFAGEEVAGLDADQRALLRRGAFGFIFQQYNLLPGSTAAENVEMPAVYAGLSPGRRTARAAEILTALGLGERLHCRPNQLSGGQQQRVSIARALINGAKVILADEPTGALDSKSGDDVMRLLGDLNARGHTVLIITHDLKIARHARRVVEMKDGVIVSDTGPDKPGFQAHDPQARAATAPPAALRLVSAFDMMEAGKMAFRSLAGNVLRTLLTLLGIIIGVASVVAMLAIGNGAKQEVLHRISAMGTNLLLIRAPPNQRLEGGLRATLVPQDAEAIAELPNVGQAVPEFPSNVTVRYGKNDYGTEVDGTTQDYIHARDWAVAAGSFFTADDVKDYAPVVVLGQTVAEALFTEGEDPIGKYILVNNNPFQVIGVMAVKGANGNNDADDVLFTPITTGAQRIYGQRYARSITVAVKDVDKIDATQAAIAALLTARHKSADFRIRNMVSVLEAASETQNTFTILLGSIAAISLLVGGIGVMNIMLVSVTERTREIGIRMATGARKLNILLQFNTEALVVCAAGGVAGVILGLATTWTFSYFGKPVEYTVGPVALAFSCAFATGLLFGYLPACKAATLDPLTALGAP